MPSISSDIPSSRRGLESAREWVLGSRDVDAALGGGLGVRAPHEIAPRTVMDGPAALGFGLALLARAPLAAEKPVLWADVCGDLGEAGVLHPPGLPAFGLDPGRFLFAMGARAKDALGAAEEAAKSGACAAVLVRAAVDFTPSRRLALAAAAGATPILILPPGPVEGANAARTRWRVAAAPSTPNPFDPHAPGRSRFDVALTRARNGRPGRWPLEWNDETRAFGLPAEPAARPLETAA